MLKERTVQLCLMRNAKEQSLEEIHRLENAMEDLTPRRPEGEKGPRFTTRRPCTSSHFCSVFDDS